VSRLSNLILSWPDLGIHWGLNQTLYTIPGPARLSITRWPKNTSWAAILLRCTWGDITPLAFYYKWMSPQPHHFAVYLDAGTIRDGLDTFIPLPVGVRHQEYVYNITPISQYFRETWEYIVMTQQSLDEILRRLKKNYVEDKT